MHHALEQNPPRRLQPAIHRDLATAQAQSALAGEPHLATLLAVLAVVRGVALAKVAPGEHLPDIRLPMRGDGPLVLGLVGRDESLPVFGKDPLPEIELCKGPVGGQGAQRKRPPGGRMQL